MKANKATSKQVERILRLYELRRETVMREARSFVRGPFSPKSADDLVATITKVEKSADSFLGIYRGFLKRTARADERVSRLAGPEG